MTFAGPAPSLLESKALDLGLVIALYRVLKTARLHDDNSDAIAQSVEAARGAIVDFCKQSDVDSATVVFAKDVVFVNGRMLKCGREAHANTMEVGGYLGRCNVNELWIGVDATAADLALMGRSVIDAIRDPSQIEGLSRKHLGAIRLRQVKALPGESDESPPQRAARLYASATVTLRTMFASLREGDPKLPRAIKRLAQRLVVLSGQEPQLLIGLVAARGSAPDEALRAVNTAILSVLAARQLTTDRVTLASVTMAAMMYDVGRPRLLAGSDRLSSVDRALSEEEQDRLPASAVAVLTALGRIHAPSMLRTTITFEALWLGRARRLGPPYRGRRPPTVLARIVQMARMFDELSTPRPDAPRPHMADVVELLTSRAADDTERAYVRVLTAALGLFPLGCTVELNTGEMAVVIGTPELPIDFARPPVRVMYNAEGALLSQPFEVDLGAPPAAGQPARCIRRAVQADHEQMKAMRAFVLQGAATGRQAAVQPSAARPALDPVLIGSPPAIELASDPAAAPGATVAGSARDIAALAAATRDPAPGATLAVSAREVAAMAAAAREAGDDLPPLPPLPPSAPTAPPPPAAPAPVPREDPEDDEEEGGTYRYVAPDSDRRRRKRAEDTPTTPRPPEPAPKTAQPAASRWAATEALLAELDDPDIDAPKKK